MLEALRLLEAFQAVAKHGVLCPIDWKPSGDAADTLNTISNTLTESYDERLANLQKEFGGVQVTDLDAKHKSETASTEGSVDNDAQADESYMETTPKPTTKHVRSHSSPERPVIQEVKCERGQQIGPPNTHTHTGSDCLPHPASPPPKPSRVDNSSAQPTSAPHSRSITPVDNAQAPPTATRRSTARHTRGTGPRCNALYINNLFTQPSPSIFQPQVRRLSSQTSSSDPSD